jgi:hypothetical protein
MKKKFLSGIALVFLGIASTATVAGATGGPSNNGPPGNNGTVKIDRAPFDSHPDNESHVGCKFEVDFYGFDKGDLDAQVTFTVQPPTGKGEVLLTDKISIGEDDNSGGGSEAGLDASREYDLTSELVGRYTEHPQQGYHVKLTVHADGSQGGDTKHKVFWVSGCASNPTPVTPVTPVTPSNPDVAQPETKVEGATLERPQVGGATVGSPQVGGAPRNGLAHTGGETLPLAGLGALLIGAGQAARLSRRRFANRT